MTDRELHTTEAQRTQRTTQNDLLFSVLSVALRCNMKHSSTRAVEPHNTPPVSRP
jgi:hypothetical protein